MLPVEGRMIRATVLWDDIPEGERKQDRLCPTWGTRVTHRGCAAAVRWPDGQGWHRCSTPSLKRYIFCRRHAERTGLLELLAAEHTFPHGMSTTIGNTIRRHVRWSNMTVGQFRSMTIGDMRKIRNAGPVAYAGIRRAQGTWTDEELVAVFGLVSDRSDNGWTEHAAMVALTDMGAA